MHIKKNGFFVGFQKAVLPLALVCLFGAEARPQVIRFSATHSWSEPYAFYDKEKNLVGGAIKETTDAIAGKLGKKASYLTLPRKVLDSASESKKIDVRCFVSRSWVKNPDLYHWTNDLFQVINVVAFSNDVPPIQKLEDLKGQKLGTVLGYRYPTVDDMLTNGSIQRSDASTGTANILKVIRQHISYGIVELNEFLWYLKSEKKKNFDTKSFLEIDRHAVQCAILKTAPLSLQNFNRAVESLRQEGFFQTLHSKYDIRN